jgi:hypothetical protein
MKHATWRFGTTGIVLAMMPLLILAGAMASAEVFQYRLPPKDVIDLLEAPQLPVPFLSPNGNYLLLAEPDYLRTTDYLIVKERGAPQPAPKVAIGPIVMQTERRYSRTSSWEDLIQSPHDEDLFEYYCTSQLHEIDVDTGKSRQVGVPGLFIEAAAPSPDGRYLLIQRVKRPYSYWQRYREFPVSIEIWDRSGKHMRTLFDLPSEDEIYRDRSVQRPRAIQWQPHKDATLVWAEPVDRKDPARSCYRDKFMAMSRCC